MDLSVFALPSEQLRLLSDRNRNDALLRMLTRRALGARVLEVGCGTGIWSCIAAKLGATRVIAVEATDVAELATQVVRANGLEGVVEVVKGRIEDIPPQPVDLVFSELLNADPFAEGVVEAMRSAARWGGRLSPSRLRVYAALTGVAEDAARERADALAEVRRVADRYDLRLGVVSEWIATAGPSRAVLADAPLAGPPVVAWDVALGTGEDPEPKVWLELTAHQDAEVGGIVVWFEADVDAGVVMHNRPGTASHWGHLVLSWPVLERVRPGSSVSCCLKLSDGQVDLV